MIMAPVIALNLADPFLYDIWILLFNSECDIMSGIAMETCHTVRETVASEVCELTIKCHCDAHYLVYHAWLTISNNSYPAKN